MYQKNLPNILTICRIACIPPILATFYIQDKNFGATLCCIIFSITCITDFLDGYIARAFKAESEFGRIMDPIADKLLVASLLVMLVKYNKAQEVPSILIILRELLISGIRDFLSSKNIIVNVSNIAKIKTFTQMIAIFILIIAPESSHFELIIGNTLLWVAAILTLITGFLYIKDNMQGISFTN